MEEGCSAEDAATGDETWEFKHHESHPAETKPTLSVGKEANALQLLLMGKEVNNIPSCILVSKCSGKVLRSGPSLLRGLQHLK